MDRIIIRGEPTGPFQHLYVYAKEKKVESIGIDFNDLEEVVFEILNKYNISHIDLSGPKTYMQGIEKLLTQANTTTYSTHNLTFRYV